jgi:flavodoxin I
MRKTLTAMKFVEEIVDLYNVKDATAEDMAQYTILIMAAPTWYDGEMQADWEDFMPKMESIDFTDKYVGLVGLGDQVGYSQYFVDAIGVIAEAATSRGAQVFGLWSKKGYEFEASKGLAKFMLSSAISFWSSHPAASISSAKD